MSPHLSRHVDNDDIRHFRFERTSGLPRGYFTDPMEWCSRRAVLWAVIGVLLLAVVAAVVVHADIPDEAIHVTTRAK